MYTIWILAWGFLSVFSTDLSPVLASDTQDTIKERSIKKRQLDFSGAGGGVNEYINGDDADYRDSPRDKINRKDENYWNSVSSVI